ncbi:hypothetical protein LXL04_021238 [Taraxacum kok-saghyz]
MVLRTEALCFPSTSSLKFCVYNDSTWDSDIYDRNSSTDSLISRKSKQQYVVSQFSTKYGYRDMAIFTYICAHISQHTPLHYENVTS